MANDDAKLLTCLFKDMRRNHQCVGHTVREVAECLGVDLVSDDRQGTATVKFGRKPMTFIYRGSEIGFTEIVRGNTNAR